MASARNASLNGGLVEPTAGFRGKAPNGESVGRSPLKLKAFCTFFYTKSGQELSIYVKICPRVWLATPRPALRFVNGGDARSAHSWIRHCLK